MRLLIVDDACLYRGGAGHCAQPRGRPPISPEIAALVVRMARENPRRGCIRILADRQDDIIQDCFACLDEIDAPGLAEFVGNAREAVRAFQDEHAKPAQALATVVLDAILRLLFAALDFSYSRIRRRPTQSTPSSSRAPTRS